MDDHRDDHAGQVLAGVFSALTAVAVMAPVVQNWRAAKRDGFPLSYFPMFTAQRPDVMPVLHLRGLDHAGEPVALHYRYAGQGGLNQVRRQLGRAVREGRGDAVATRVAASVARQPELRHVRKVQIVRGTYRLDAWFEQRDRSPVSERVVVEVKVRRA